DVGSELRPGSIHNTFGHTMVMDHAVNSQIFNRNQIKPINEAATLLMAKVPTPVADALMDACDDATALCALWRALLRSRQFALRPLQVLLVTTQKLWARGLFTSREGGEARQTHINPDRFASR